MDSFSKLLILQNLQKSQQLNIYQQFFHSLPQNQYIIDNQPKSNHLINMKTHQNISVLSTKSLKSVKGRPKKKQKKINKNLLIEQQYFSQHQKTIFSLALTYPYKALQKYKRYNKYGFLHQKIVDQQDYYYEVEQSIQNNEFFKIEYNYERYLKNEIKKSLSLCKCIQKILWIGPRQIMDQIIYLITHILCKYEQYEYKQEEDLLRNILIFQQQFVQCQYSFLYNKFKFLTFKNERLKIKNDDRQKIENEFTEFIKVLTTTILLVKFNFIQNHYFIKYYQSKIFQNLHIKPKIKSNIQISPSQNQFDRPIKKIYQNQIQKNLHQQQQIYLGDSFD